MSHYDRGDSVDISQPETENDNENHDLPEANENAINQGATEDIIHSQQQQTTTTTEVTESEEVQFQLIAKTTTTGKKSHIFKVGNYKYLGRGIKRGMVCPSSIAIIRGAPLSSVCDTSIF